MIGHISVHCVEGIKSLFDSGPSLVASSQLLHLRILGERCLRIRPYCWR